MENLINVKRGRRLAAIVAIVLVAAIAITGTFAWTSIFQAADNTIRAENNPGGRLHDDFDGENKDVYAENFGDVPILVRIRLDETFSIDGNTILNNSPNIPQMHVCPIHTECWCNRNLADLPAPGAPGSGNPAARPYITWEMGGTKVHMPTNNTDNNSLASNTSGQGVDHVTGGQTAPSRWIGVPLLDTSGNPVFAADGVTPLFESFTEVPNDGSHDFWAAGETTFAVNPNLAGTLEVVGMYAGLNISEVPYLTARSTLAPMAGIPNGGVITMQEWRLLPANQQVGNFWVIDADGWAYWANLLQPGTTTSLLLNGIDVTPPAGNEWVYTITPIAEFSTRTSWHNNPGGQSWFDSVNGEPSRVAVDLLARVTAHVVNPAGTVLRTYPLAAQNQAPVALGNGFYWNPVNQLVVFGQYWQTTAAAEAGAARTDAMRTPLEWFLLDIVDGQALLVTRYGIENVRFNRLQAYGREYATSNIRNWLNSTGDRFSTNANGNQEGFWSTAFSAADQTRVVVAPQSRFHNNSVVAWRDGEQFNTSTQYGIVPAGDRVFALSLSEIWEYFGRHSHNNRVTYVYPIQAFTDSMTRATDFAVALGAWESEMGTNRENTGNTRVFTRSIGLADRIIVINNGGMPNVHYTVSNNSVTARPAIWVSLGN